MHLWGWMADLLKNKSRPEAAANSATEWVESERTMREKLAKEREAREHKEKLEVSALFSLSDPDRYPSSGRLPHPHTTQTYLHRSLTTRMMLTLPLCLF